MADDVTRKKMWKHSLMYVIMMMEEDGKKNLQLSIILGTVIWSKRNNQKHDNVVSNNVWLLWIFELYIVFSTISPFPYRYRQKI